MIVAANFDYSKVRRLSQQDRKYLSDEDVKKSVDAALLDIRTQVFVARYDSPRMGVYVNSFILSKHIVEHSHMIRATENQKEKRARPFCQATGCFDFANVYIVLKETEEPDYYEVSRESNYRKAEKGFDNEMQFDGFKMILYLCDRHDGEFKYLIRGSELRIAKRCNLLAPEIR